MRTRALPVLLVGLLSACSSYPSRADIDATLGNLRIVPPPTRSERLRRLISRLKSPDSKEDDDVLRYALTQLRSYYDSSYDPAVLEALDSVRIDGGFGNEICESYRRLLATAAAREHYRTRGVAPLERCVGFPLDKSDVDAISHGTRPPAL